MDKTIRKFFNADGRETTADKATICHEIVVNEKGAVVSDGWYYPKKAAAEKSLQPEQKSV